VLFDKIQFVLRELFVCGVVCYGSYVLASLRRLGKGFDFDDTISLGANISGSQLIKFHHALMEEIGAPAGRIYSRWVRPPDEGEEVEQCMKPFTLMGIPGAMGSVDGVHIPWERCPKGLSSWFVGKEGFPTLMFNCTVNHQGRFLNVSGPHPGARNDKTAVR
jgi:hypothetical protein